MGFEMKTPHCVTHRKSEQCRVKCKDYLGVVLLLPPNHIHVARLSKMTPGWQCAPRSRSRNRCVSSKGKFQAHKRRTRQRGTVNISRVTVRTLVKIFLIAVEEILHTGGKRQSGIVENAPFIARLQTHIHKNRGSDRAAN